MNSKFFKVYYIVAGSFGGLAVLYYIARLIDLLVNENDISGTLFGKLNIVAIIFLAISLIMLVVGMMISNKKSKTQINADEVQTKDQELLAKYKSKKK